MGENENGEAASVLMRCYLRQQRMSGQTERCSPARNGAIARFSSRNKVDFTTLTPTCLECSCTRNRACSMEWRGPGTLGSSVI